MNPLSSTPASEPASKDLTVEGSESPSLDLDSYLDPASHSEFQNPISISLLEERLKVSYQRRKIGEVVVHKKVETRIIEVPVRYEKLIIEQISPEPKQLAEVDLGTNLSLDTSLVELSPSIVRGEFTSPRFASQILYELGKTLPHQCKRVSIEIELEDASLTEAYQQRLDQFIDRLSSQPSSPSPSSPTSSWSEAPADPAESHAPS